jgi:integrase
VPRKRRCFSKTIEEHGIAVRLYERAVGGALYLETRQGGEKRRKSLGHRDRALAEGQARQVAQRLAEFRHAGGSGPVTLGQLVRLYAQHRLPLLSPGRQRHARQHAAFFLAHLGDGFRVEDLGQTHVDGFAAARRSGVLRAKRRTGEGVTVRDGTVRQNLNWLAALLRWARGFRVDGRRLLTVNPLEGVALPQERNVRRPIASEARYRRTVAVADQVEPTGRLRCLLALARYTGRRINALCQLRAADVLLSREAVERALAAAGMDERQAEYMPHGAVRWASEHDKLGYLELTALSAPARSALEAYLGARPAIGAAPLFPRTDDSTRPINKMHAEHWLSRAEQRAKLPKLDRGLWHPYRRLWASERKHLPDPDVAKAGGWRDVSVMRSSYQLADPATVLRVIENAPPGHTLDTQTTNSQSGPTT